MIAVPPAGQETRSPDEERGADEPLQPIDVRHVASATTRNGKPVRFTIERQDNTDRRCVRDKTRRIVHEHPTKQARTSGKVEVLGIYQRGSLMHGLRRWFISECRNA
jgi:hypothetical protein